MFWHRGGVLMGALRALVTGGTSGIGGAIAEALALTGAEVIAVGRNRDRGEAWAARVRSRGGRVQFWAGDLGDQAGTLALAARVLDDPAPLDVLINNVGGVWESREETPEGLEKTLAINHVHPFLLAACLYPRLRERRGRILFTTSGYQELVHLGPPDWHQKRFDSGMNVYGRAKKISLLVILALASRCSAEGVSLQFADPGMAWTPLTRRMGKGYFPAYGRFLVPAIHEVQKRLSLEWAARSTVDLVTDAADRRPGVYAWPFGLRTSFPPRAVDRYRGRLLWRLTVDRWLTPGARARIGSPWKGDFL